MPQCLQWACVSFANDTTVQSQKTLAPYFSSKQLLLFGFVEEDSAWNNSLFKVIALYKRWPTSLN